VGTPKNVAYLFTGAPIDRELLFIPHSRACGSLWRFCDLKPAKPDFKPILEAIFKQKSSQFLNKNQAIYQTKI